jgi:hypothetical protein
MMQAMQAFYERNAIPASKFACVLFATSQPEEVDIYEILLPDTAGVLSRDRVARAEEKVRRALRGADRGADSRLARCL